MLRPPARSPLAVLAVPAVLLAALAGVPGCAAEDKDTAAPFDIHVAPDGKADGPAGLLSAEDLARLEEAFDQVIASGQATIDQLEAEIAALEASNATKAAEIDALVQQIEQRRDELEDQHQQNLVFCVLFPNPATCVLAVMISNDSRMQSLERDLAAARATQRQIQEDIARYEARRDALRAELVPLRASKDRLIALFQSGLDGQPVPDVLPAGSPEATAFARAEVLAEISGATREEIAILVDIRNAAVELAAALDDALDTVRALATSVDELVEEARGQFMDMIEALLAGDADALARDWLDQALADATRDMLAGLDWPVREFVQHLIDNRGEGEVDLDALAQQLIEKLLAVDQRFAASAVAVSILDGTVAVSPIDLDESFEASRVEVSVDIEHSYIGDLRIWLEHGGQEIVLHDRTGGADDGLRVTWTIELPAGYQAGGTWRLHVADEANDDQGQLRGWDLLLTE